MSKYTRKREFVEGEDAKADDIEVEFDNIAAVLQNGITVDNLAPGYMPRAGGFYIGSSPLPASGSGLFSILAEQSFEVLRASVVKFDYFFELKCTSLGNEGLGVGMSSRLYLDGTAILSSGAEIPRMGAGLTDRRTVSGTIMTPLTAGGHAFHLVGEPAAFNSPSTTVINGGFLSLLTLPQ